MSTPPATVLRALERMKSNVDSELLWKFITTKRLTDVTPLKKLKDEIKLDDKMNKLVKAYHDFKKNQDSSANGKGKGGKGKGSGTNALLQNDVFKTIYLPTQSCFRVNGSSEIAQRLTTDTFNLPCHAQVDT